jgi:RimJ/RimL family protein N-acetyltransferase
VDDDPTPTDGTYRPPGMDPADADREPGRTPYPESAVPEAAEVLDPDEHRPPPDPRKPLPGEWSRRVKLRDGTRVLLRPLRPEDRQRIVEGLKRLSPASRYLRFHATVDHLSERQLDYLVLIDHVDHEAIVGIDLDRPDRPGVGVARYIRDAVDHDVAEAAITVADEYHGMGAGTILLGALAARARANGVHVFRSYVLDGNPGMLEVFDHLGARRELEADGLWRVDLDVPEDETDVPASPAGRAFLEAAREQRRLVSLLPPVWSRRKHHRDEGTDEGPDEAPDVHGSGSATSEDDASEATDPMEREFEEIAEDLDDWLASRDQR